MRMKQGWPGLQRSEAPEGHETRKAFTSDSTDADSETRAGASRWSSPGYPRTDNVVRVAETRSPHPGPLPEGERETHRHGARHDDSHLFPTNHVARSGRHDGAAVARIAPRLGR